LVAAFLTKLGNECLQARNTNDAYRGTLSSYCYVLMCIALLQRRSPPVLPVLQAMQPTFRRCVHRACMTKLHLSPHHARHHVNADGFRECARLSPRPGCRSIDNWCCDYNDNVRSLLDFGAANTETLAELTAAFFAFWAWDFNYGRDVISIRTGRVLTKHEKVGAA
jgi:DNA polymerase sigma